VERSCGKEEDNGVTNDAAERDDDDNPFEVEFEDDVEEKWVSKVNEVDMGPTTPTLVVVAVDERMV
jgi:hypothetical protein